jgi:hypothetical protein
MFSPPSPFRYFACEFTRKRLGGPPPGDSIR